VFEMTLMEQLKLAQSELTIRQREFNTAQRNLNRVLAQITYLEKRIELARNAKATDHTDGE
jgi:uncharacterized protein YaeQ